MQYREHTYEFLFEDDSKNAVRETVKGESEKGEAYNEARERICDNRGLTKTTFESKFTLESSTHSVGLKNEPWDNWNEFESDIKSIDGVRSLTYISPLTGAYGPPCYYVRTGSRDTDDIVQEIENYYGGMSVERNGDNVKYLGDKPTRLRIRPPT